MKKIKSFITEKKADMTIQVVVLAALALIFFIVVVYIMGGRLALFSGELDACENKGGTCVVPTDENKAYGTKADFSCPENQECRLNTCEGKGGSCETDCTGEQFYFAACEESSDVCCKI